MLVGLALRHAPRLTCIMPLDSIVKTGLTFSPLPASKKFEWNFRGMPVADDFLQTRCTRSQYCPYPMPPYPLPCPPMKVPRSGEEPVYPSKNQLSPILSIIIVFTMIISRSTSTPDMITQKDFERYISDLFM